MKSLYYKQIFKKKTYRKQYFLSIHAWDFELCIGGYLAFTKFFKFVMTGTFDRLFDFSCNINQRTSGPVNSHLTPGPGIYFNAFIYVYSTRAGADNPLGTKFNTKAFSLCPYVARFKMISSKSDFLHIFNDFIHIYSPGTRAENPFGTNF